ncbi:MAG: hypothetical protein AAF960_08335 [Bacteroidota bacterium]
MKRLEKYIQRQTRKVANLEQFLTDFRRGQLDDNQRWLLQNMLENQVKLFEAMPNYHRLKNLPSEGLQADLAKRYNQQATHFRTLLHHLQTPQKEKCVFLLS